MMKYFESKYLDLFFKMNFSLLMQMRVVGFLVFLILVGSGAARPWTNSEGKKIEADFVRLENDQVVLSLKGKEIKYPLSKLSEADQEFAKESAKKMEAPVGEDAEWTFGGESVKVGAMTMSIVDLPTEKVELALNGLKGWTKEKGQPVGKEIEKAALYLGLPDDFNPKKSTPIYIPWNTSDYGEHKLCSDWYWKMLKDEGFLVLASDGHPDSKGTWSASVHLATSIMALEELKKTFPESASWPIIVGGFSGGSKAAQVRAPLIAEAGYPVKGIYVGGCNQAFVLNAMEDYNVRKATFRSMKIFVSTAKADEYVNEEQRDRVAKGLKKTGATIRSELYEGGHSMNEPQLVEGLKWILVSKEE